MSGPDGVIADLRRRTEELEDARRRAATVTGTAQSPDGSIVVSVDATGAVTDVRLAPTAFDRTTPEKLSRTITDVARQAAAEARSRTAAIFGAAPTEPVVRRPRRSDADDEFAADGILG